ncbi:hypothetical protein VTJ04DRAFT_10677 [Mycothermus thermophilus]|uniref:uncharacterized protein n=1 Tax=Humicola insolens TaxID=85995 RepID=UPI0037432EE4
MDTSTDPRPGDEDFEGFRMRLPEDCVEYMLFVLGDKSDASLPSLEAVRKAADAKLNEIAKDYIWQRDPFKLETKVQKGIGLPFLYGATHYGDNVEDEWLIVYLLRELTKSFPNLWVRVSDSDGEFLLIEAAKVTPKWLTPENDTNRVWIHDGKLFLIPPETNQSVPSKPLTLPQALTTLRTRPPSQLIHSPEVESEAFYRLEKYPAHIATTTHHALATIPRKLAYILHARPHSVAPAVEAFYLRDPRSLKPLLSPSPSNLTFPPRDLVTISVRFTKTLYAQLKSQRFSPPPPVWREAFRSIESAGTATSTAAESAKSLARLELGMKLTTGFELLLAQPPSSGTPHRVVREIQLLLSDLAEDGGDAALPSDAEIRAWEGVEKEDDDGWMDIDFTDFEAELSGGAAAAAAAAAASASGGGKGFGDATTQADLRKIVSRFEAFLNDETAGIDGAEIDEMDRDNDDDDDTSEDGESDEDEDKDVSFDEEQFARMMREVMGLSPANQPGEQGNGKGPVTTTKAAKTAEEEEDEEIRQISSQIESELKSLGALELDRPPKLPKVDKASAIQGRSEPGPSTSSSSSKAVSKPTTTTTTTHDDEEASDDDDEEEDEESEAGSVDIDYNLAKNLLESFKSQAGMAGPAGNLLGLMGVRLPRDEGEDGDEGGRKS